MNYKIVRRTVLIISTQFLAGTLLAAPTMYVPTGVSNEIIIIDLLNDKVLGRIDKLENAHGLSSSDNTEYLVAGSMQGVDPVKKTSISKSAKIGEAEHKSHHTNDAQGQSAANQSNKMAPSFVSIVHPKHGHVMNRVKVRALTHHTAVAPDGKTAVVVHSGAGGVSVIDLNRMEVVSTIDTGLRPNYAVYSRDGKSVYVSNTIPGTISQIYAVGKQVHGIDTSADGRWLFVANKGDNTLSRVELSNGKITSMQLNPAPYHVTFLPGQNKLYVSSRKQPKIWVIDPTTLTVQNEINIGKGVAHQMVVKM